MTSGNSVPATKQEDKKTQDNVGNTEHSKLYENVRRKSVYGGQENRPHRQPLRRRARIQGHEVNPQTDSHPRRHYPLCQPSRTPEAPS